MKTPCPQNCPDRVSKIEDGKIVNCHDYCEKYLAYREENLLRYEHHRKRVIEEQVIRDGVDRVMKRRWKK